MIERLPDEAAKEMSHRNALVLGHVDQPQKLLARQEEGQFRHVVVQVNDISFHERTRKLGEMDTDRSTPTLHLPLAIRMPPPSASGLSA
jgi:hypothetical protein